MNVSHGAEARLCRECDVLEDEHIYNNAVLLAAAPASATRLDNTVTFRGLVLLTRSGFWRERDIIISFRGDLDSTGSCSQIVRLFSTV